MNRLYQRRAWDFTGIPELAHRKILQGALDACDYPFSRIRKNTGQRVPVTISDLSRFAAQLGASAHTHVHDEDGTEGHLLGDPFAPRAEGEAGARATALGLFWLPTSRYPAGRVELDGRIMSDPDLAREVFLAEGAHAVDYGVPLTDEKRAAITAAYLEEHRDPDGVDDWFEEHGEQDYWSWTGESFMSGFTRAFAPSLPRPLEARQPWVHPSSDAIAERIRAILR